MRPGGRTARVREAVLKAAGDTLATDGFASLDLTEIARRADVGKTTVYRRWGTPGALAADLLSDMAATSSPAPTPAPSTTTSPPTPASSSRPSPIPARAASSRP